METSKIVGLGGTAGVTNFGGPVFGAEWHDIPWACIYVPAKPMVCAPTVPRSLAGKQVPATSTALRATHHTSMIYRYKKVS